MSYALTVSPMRIANSSNSKTAKAFWKLNLILLFFQTFAAQGSSSVTNIAAGSYHSLLLKSDGSLWGMGDNAFGELGWDTLANTNRPRQIVASNVVAISAGRLHSLFLKADGSLWGMGDNFFGEVGDGTFNRVYTPKQVVPNGVVAISVGSSHSLFLKSDSSLWGMGYNIGGELGDGRVSQDLPFGTNVPVQILSNNVVAIAGGETFSIFLKSDGSLWAMGSTGTFVNTNRPEQIVPSDVVAIAAGGEHCLFLKSDGSLWGMGQNGEGQLGDGTHNWTNTPMQIVSSNVVAIAAGWKHSLFIKSNGSLWGMGLNEDGELGQGYYGFGNSISMPVQIISEDVIAIAAGERHSLFLKSDGSLWAMGDNYVGKLGDGFHDLTPFPEQILPLPQPLLSVSIPWSGYSLAKTNLHFGAKCRFGGVFYLLSTTNLALQPNQWAKVASNVVSNRNSYDFTGLFDATLTNEISPDNLQRFYMLQSE